MCSIHYGVHANPNIFHLMLGHCMWRKLIKVINGECPPTFLWKDYLNPDHGNFLFRCIWESPFSSTPGCSTRKFLKIKWWVCSVQIYVVFIMTALILLLIIFYSIDCSTISHECVARWGKRWLLTNVIVYWRLICYDAYSNPNFFAIIAILFFSIFLQRWGHLKNVDEYET